MIKSIEWFGDSVRFIDQTELPLRESYIQTSELSVLINAILTLKVRGAPLLGIAAGYGILLGMLPAKERPASTSLQLFEETARTIMNTRPTAKNLFTAVERMRKIVRLNEHDDSVALFEKLDAEAQAIHEEDRIMCDVIGRHGSALIPHGATIITHCNTGALATGGIGTAFGVLETAHRSGKKIFVYADETRPLLQGSRLTMWELEKAEIPSAVITDNAAAWTMKMKNVDLVIVGADRIAANGDTANKIGTYQLAISAKAHGIPFYVAAPTSTIDLSISDGGKISIEERSREEITNGFGRQTAPDAAAVFAPAFDITPHDLITAIVTEKGVIRQPYQRTISSAVNQ